MKRGHTLIEMIVAIAILAVVLPVSLRLLFTMDWALGAEAEKLERTGGQAQLLEDLGADIRGARTARAGRDGLRLRGPTNLRYYWDEQQQATVRETLGAAGETRIYPGVRAEFVRTGRMVRVHISAGETELRTAYYLRNR